MTRATQHCWSCCERAEQQQTPALLGLAACQTSSGTQLLPVVLLEQHPTRLLVMHESAGSIRSTLSNMACCLVVLLLCLLLWSCCRLDLSSELALAVDRAADQRVTLIKQRWGAGPYRGPAGARGGSTQGRLAAAGAAATLQRHSSCLQSTLPSQRPHYQRLHVLICAMHANPMASSAP
jgi:hypothetical protein